MTKQEKVLKRALEMAVNYAWKKIDCPDCPCECDGTNYVRVYCEKTVKSHFIRKAKEDVK